MFMCVSLMEKAGKAWVDFVADAILPQAERPLKSSVILSLNAPVDCSNESPRRHRLGDFDDSVRCQHSEIT